MWENLKKKAIRLFYQTSDQEHRLSSAHLREIGILGMEQTGLLNDDQVEMPPICQVKMILYQYFIN
jgi:hypothetical protein